MSSCTRYKRYHGFTLIELMTVLTLMSVLAVYVLPRITNTDAQQVQSGRDDIVAAFFSAQQLAMVRSSGVRLMTTATQVDIRLDADGNGVFVPAESVQSAGIQYPLNLPFGVSVSAANFDYDRLGRTTPMNLSVTKGVVSATITVSGSGYAY